MKNISYVIGNELQECKGCKLKGVFSYNLNGGSFQTCPCCGKNDFLNDTIKYKKNPTKYGFIFEDYDDYHDEYDNDKYQNDIRIKYRYCNFCKILFDSGCIHYIAKGSDDVTNGHFIKKWKNKITGIVYQGMPQFDNEDDWLINANNVQVLQMYCPHNSNKCKIINKKIDDDCKL